MQKDRFYIPGVHHGHNIKQIRRSRGLSRQSVAEKTGIPPETACIYESMVCINDIVLDKFAGALQVPLETLKFMERGTPTIVIENNTFTNNQNVSNVGNYNLDDSSTNIFNPIDKIVELYERLLNATILNSADIKQRMSDLESKV